MSTSEQYPGYKTITSYLKERENCQENWSYHGFLLFHHDDIIASSSSNKWKKLNNFWMNSFLKEARKLIINQEIYNAIEEKVNKEQTRYAKELEIYWKEVITELNKKDSVKRKFEEEKENLSPQSKKSRSTITLFCMVQGNVNNAFSININKNKTISELKSLIQKEKYNDFAGIDPDQLKLWQVEIPDEHYDDKYFIKDPVDEHIHIIVSLPETTKTRQELELTELELINKVAELQKLLLKKSIYEFNIIVNPKRTKASKWIANIEQVTLKDLKEFIFALYQSPELQKDVATLAFSCNDEKYSPKSDLEFQNMLQLFVSKNSLKFTVFIETSISFSSWTFPRVCWLYKLSEDSDPSLSVFSLFNCGFIDLNDEKSQVIIKHLMTDLNFRFKAIPIGNEASKSQYVCSYLVAIANLFEDKFKICPEKNVSGLNGHGPVDFALIQVQTSRIIGITEVKDKDFQQGVAQNAVQCESALSSSKKKVFGIITDSEKWFFLECSLDNERKPKFKLSKPVVIIYGDEDMENRVKKVLGHIAWLLEEAQKLNELEDKN
uniref:Crinkler effector protein N-terminal domain-containing protein n=1 Tax=Rhizophagus irregularis (strain DAOM 181602 / DAOM 197198 / MUCL 43194) TaxID=747089 RepID=U9TX99_RHIID